MTRKTLLVLVLASMIAMPCMAQKRSGSKGTVVIPEKIFHITDLGRYRKIRIYLPPGYELGKETYPVVYMHDGQNLFDEATSYAGEWRVDENLNELAEETGLKLIVVGLDNSGEHRSTELSPWLNDRIGGTEGKEYMKFMVEVIKPYIDENYRTKSDRNHTAIIGSSLGGLISHYAIYEYPEVFGKAGIFSPSYWVSEKVFELTKESPLTADHRLYLLMGGKEGVNMNLLFLQMYKLIEKARRPATDVKAKINPEGEHNERFWDSEFKTAVKWLFRK